MSPRYSSSEMGLPTFRGAVRQIILFSTAVYVVLLLLLAFAPGFGQAAFALGLLQPDKVLHGQVWQLVTYAFMYSDPLAFILSLVGIYFIGSAVEDQVGSRRFYGLFFGSLVLAGVLGVALSLTGVLAHGAAAGSGAAANAILMVFYLLNRGAPIMLFPIPIQYHSPRSLSTPRTTVTAPPATVRTLIERSSTVFLCWALIHRPVPHSGGAKANMWLSFSPDLHNWGDHSVLLEARDGAWWDAGKIGLSPQPIETVDGWLVIYHGVRNTPAGALYRVGLALLDLDDPRRVLRRGDEWVVGPRETYEVTGDIPNVVFPCGAVLDRGSGNLRVYYGAADTCVGLMTAQIGDVLDWLRTQPAPVVAHD